MLRNNIKSSWNRSNVFGRKAVYVPPSRVGDLGATASPASSPDAEKEQSNVEDVANTTAGKTANEPNLPGVGGKENILSATEPNDTVVENSEVEASEKRAAKRKKQKENKLILGYDVQKLSGDSWTLEGALKYCGLGQKPAKDSTEVTTEEKMKARKHPSKQAVETGLERKDAIENDSGFGDWNRHETTLGLASVKNGLVTPSSELSEDSEHGKDLSECSEVISPAELDADDILRSLVADKAAGHDFESVRMGIVDLPNTLDQQSSVTDSSGVETSSDADSDHAMYVIESVIDQKSDVPNDQHPDLHQPEDSACEQEAEFTTVSKKRKPKSLQVDRNAKYTPPFSSTDFVSPDSGESSPQLEQTTSIGQLPNSSCTADRPTVHKECVKLPENRLSLGVTAHALLNSEPCSGTTFDLRHQPSADFSAPPETSTAEKQVSDHDSMYVDNVSGRASLSDVSLDDFAFSCLLKETLDDDWTVVKSGRRSKNNVQSTTTVDSPSPPGENKQSVPVNVGQCSAIREHVDYGRGKVGTNSGRGKWSTPNSRCKGFDGSNSKTFDRCWHDNGTKARPQEAAGQKDFLPSGVARCTSSNEPKYRDTANCDKLSRCNSNKEDSLSESNPVVAARCILGIPRFSQKSTLSKSGVPSIVANSSEGAKPASHAELADDAARDTEEGLSSEKTRLSTENNKSTTASTSSKLPAAEKTLIKYRTFNLIEAQIFLYREYQEVLKERRKIPHLVVIYDPDSDL